MIGTHFRTPESGRRGHHKYAPKDNAPKDTQRPTSNIWETLNYYATSALNLFSSCTEVSERKDGSDLTLRRTFNDPFELTIDELNDTNSEYSTISGSRTSSPVSQTSTPRLWCDIPITCIKVPSIEEQLQTSISHSNLNEVLQLFQVEGNIGPLINELNENDTLRGDLFKLVLSQGTINDVEFLCNCNVNLTETLKAGEFEGYTLFHLAGIEVKKDILEFLIDQQGVDINYPIQHKVKYNGHTLLEVAIKENNIQLVDFLLNQEGIDTTHKVPGSKDNAKGLAKRLRRKDIVDRITEHEGLSYYKDAARNSCEFGTKSIFGGSLSHGFLALFWL